MLDKIYISNSIEDTYALASIIRTVLVAGSVITLDGDLGAGKTCFTKGLAKALKIDRAVTSPTFNIMKIYDGEMKLNHLDVYRLDGIGFDFDLEEYIYSDGVSVIEWSHNIEEIFDATALRIEIKVTGDTAREYHIKSSNAAYQKLEELL